MNTATDKPVVTIYVRLGRDDDERRISFRIPRGVASTDLLERGFAIDGNEAVGMLEPMQLSDLEEGFGGQPPFNRFPYDPAMGVETALRVEELGLMSFFREHGYDVQFV